MTNAERAKQLKSEVVEIARKGRKAVEERNLALSLEYAAQAIQKMQEIHKLEGDERALKLAQQGEVIIRMMNQ